MEREVSDFWTQVCPCVSLALCSPLIVMEVCGREEKQKKPCLPGRNMVGKNGFIAAENQGFPRNVAMAAFFHAGCFPYPTLKYVCFPLFQSRRRLPPVFVSTPHPPMLHFLTLYALRGLPSMTLSSQATIQCFTIVVVSLRQNV